MNNSRNLTIYRIWSPIYDRLFGPVFDRARLNAIQALDLQPGEHLFIPGIGTGLDLPHLPAKITVTGIDFSPAMLAQAQSKIGTHAITLHEMDAQNLAFEDAAFDAVLCNLVLSVVPDGAAAFRAAWRVLKPGGRLVIFDKFMPDDARDSLGQRVIGRIVRAFGTDPNRKLSDIIGSVDGITVARDEPRLLRGKYRIIVLRKK